MNAAIATLLAIQASSPAATDTITHPHSPGMIAMGVFFVWLFFFVGETLHIWLRASLAINSGLNAIKTYATWFQVKGPVVAGRLFLETCLFMVFEYGSVAWFPNLLPHGGSFLIKVPVAGVFGYGADSLLDQAFAKIGIDKELPPALNVAEDTVGSNPGPVRPESNATGNAAGKP